ETPPNRQLCLAFFRSLLVVCASDSDMRDMITRYTGQAPEGILSLAGSETYRTALASLPATTRCRMFVNIQQATGLLRPILGLKRSGSSSLQGLLRIQSIASS